MTQPWALLSREERLALVAASWRRAVPTFMTIVSVIGMVLPVFLPGPVLPHLPFLCIFYWSIHRPDLMPSWAAFLAGLVIDATLTLPIGLNATLFTLFSAGLASQVMVFQSRPFAFSLAVGAFVVLLFQLLSWVLLLFFQPELHLAPFLVQGLTTLAMLPFVFRVGAFLQVRVVDRF
ncbi:rod shape-determining protein MreD [Pedomonas mirosovicensis]|uniref:rod shape-determining protein MreD n=1 Tax=Pedomonas mirosovicensis TaxID=2908641 RepID=UPI002169B567|nr:rod shape-determining protein MreD [Pedomonas mirosovicensis]MCH8684807.1 rod shape-determining protein MreD [Pedomonas mirosovicensis]